MTDTFVTVDDYVRSFPDAVQAILQEIRRTIGQAVPGVGETISYQMPTITLNGTSLVHFAAWKHHIGVYPIPSGDESLERELARYRATEGTARFPFRDPMPYDLIGRMAALLAGQRVVAPD